MDPPPERPPAPKQGGPSGAQGGSTNGAGNGGASGRPGPPPAGGPPAQGNAPPTALVPRFKQMKRAGLGKNGAPVQLQCNHFRVKFQPREDVFHYNVTIEPETKKLQSRKIMEKLYSTFGKEFLNGKRFAYDGEKSLFTVGPLGFQSHKFPVHLDDDPGWISRRYAAAAADKGEGGGGGDEERQAQRRRIGGGRDFEVEIKHAAKVNMSVIAAVLDGKADDATQRLAQDSLRVLDIMLREHAAKRDYLQIRDCYFHSSLGPVSNIGDGVEAWRGFHVSFRPSSGGCLTLNFDLSTTTVLKRERVDKFLSMYCKKDVSRFVEADWHKARRVLKGLFVDTYTNRKMKIGGLSPVGCHQLTFEKRVRNPSGEAPVTESPQMVTVADYFTKERGLTLHLPQLPALNLGRETKPQYFPMELCTIAEGQRYKKNLSGVQRKNQIDSARQGPEERKKICAMAMEKNDYNNDPLVKEFNVQIERTMATVRGRVLDAPSLLFGNREERPRDGRWNFNSKKVKFNKEIKTWAVANFSRNHTGKQIATQLKNVCAQKGLKFSSEPIYFEEDRSMMHRGAEERVKKMILQDMESLRPEFVLAILPEKSSDLYAPLKRICETGRWARDLNPNEPNDKKDPTGQVKLEVNIVSQCVVPPRQVKDQYLTNVALKINLKWGGYNTLLAHEEKKSLPKVSQVPTCIFGLDVSHGSPGDASSPSIAAAVASNNWPNFSTYTTRVRAQAPKTEMIEGLYEEAQNGKKGGMVMELMQDFFSSCQGSSIANRKPQQFVIFRDGVSESQFEQVLEKELTAFKKAARALEPNPNSSYNPKVTFIVVQKRHHTRFFPATGSGNVRPGTIVDNEVCHPRDNDFFLCSHAGLIGTTRPTHYHVLYDEIGFTSDELQMLTHCLCYNFSRCTTAVSVAAPAYYAHLAAQHCRNFIAGDGSGSESSSVTGRGASFTALPVLNSKILKKMFYT